MVQVREDAAKTPLLGSFTPVSLLHSKVLSVTYWQAVRCAPPTRGTTEFWVVFPLFSRFF